MKVKNEEKIYTISDYGCDVEVKIAYGRYACDDSLSAMLMCKPDFIEEELDRLRKDKKDIFVDPYAVITVHLPESTILPTYEQFVDTNNHPDIGDWLEKNGIAVPTGKIGLSGFCRYPGYDFSISLDSDECD